MVRHILWDGVCKKGRDLSDLVDLGLDIVC